MKNNIPQLNQVEVFHENTHSTHYEGEIKDIKINDHSVGTLTKLEAQISELKKQVGILFAVTLIAGFASISTGVNGNELKTKMMVQDESRRIMSETMNDMRNRVHYMMDVTPLNRAENPYQDYRMQYIPTQTQKKVGVINWHNWQHLGNKSSGLCNYGEVVRITSEVLYQLS